MTGTRLHHLAAACVVLLSLLTCDEHSTNTADDVRAVVAPGPVAVPLPTEPVQPDAVGGDSRDGSAEGGAICVTPDGAPFESETC